MIVAREDESRVHTSTGVWGRVTLDQIVAKNAESRPDHPALIDFSDRPDWTGGAPERLTWRDLRVRVDALAAFFAAVGLLPDTVIALQMPPTIDATVAFLACSRAGLIVAPLPLGTREADAIDVFRRLGVKAIVTTARTETEAHGERLRDVAAELFQIRYVFGAGGDLPDGLVDLGLVFAEAASLGSPPEISRKGNPADHALTVEIVSLPAEEGAEPSTEPTGSRAMPLPRSHNHWIATGLMTLLEARIDASSVVLTPFAPTGLIGIGVALVPWLVSGATLVCGLPRGTDALAAEAAATGATHVLLPQRFAARFAERLTAHRSTAAVIAVADDEAADRPMPHGTEVIDVTPLGAYALVARRRTESALARALPIGPTGAPAETPMAPTLIEMRLKAIPQRAGQMIGGRPLGGEIQVRGAMVPHFNWPMTGNERKHRPRDADGWTPTGLGARIVTAQPPTFEPAGRTDGAARIGQTILDLDALDLVYRSIEGIADAAALVVEDADAGPSVAAAVVPRPGRRFDEEEFLRAVEETRIGLAKIPTRVFAVPAIARGPSGRVLRSGMAQHLMARP
ncbi:MAG: class I adenylate-forming enzyme family protein [Siculibacillus sp.]